MSTITLNTERCKGCRLCVGVCPKQVIIPLQTLNKKGYEITAVDQDKCVGCGSCYQICPDYVYEIREGGEN